LSWLGESCSRPWLVANPATLPQKWPPPPDSCKRTATTKPTELSIVYARAILEVVAIELDGGAPRRGLAAVVLVVERES